MALFSFLFYTIIAGGRLTVSKTFTSLALFAALQSPMMELPDQFFSFLHGKSSMISAGNLFKAARSVCIVAENQCILARRGSRCMGVWSYEGMWATAWQDRTPGFRACPFWVEPGYRWLCGQAFWVGTFGPWFPVGSSLTCHWSHWIREECPIGCVTGR